MRTRTSLSLLGLLVMLSGFVVGTVALAAPNDNSTTTITITFSDDCSSFTVTTDPEKAISHVSVDTDGNFGFNNGGNMTGFEFYDAPGTPSASYGPGDYTHSDVTTVQAKAGSSSVVEQCPTDPGCPDGQVADSVTGDCVPPCPDGSAPADGECPPVPCPEGQVADSVTGACVTPCPDGSPPANGECPTEGGAEAELLNLGVLNPVDDVVSNGANTDPSDEEDEGLLSAIADGMDLIFAPAPCPIPVAAECGLLWETDNDSDEASTGVLLLDDPSYGLILIVSDCGDATLLEGHIMGNGGNLWDELNGASGGQLGAGLNALSVQIQENGNVVVVDLGGEANNPANDGPLGELVIGHSSCD